MDKKLSSNRIFGRKADATRILLSVVFIALVFIPLVRMFANIDAGSLSKVIASPTFGIAVANSITATLIATILTLFIAYFLAACIERTNIRFKSLFGIIFVLPMLIPSISNGMGLIILFGNNGIITKLFGLNTSIYGLHGIILGSILYAFPVAYLMLSDVMRYEDSSPYEAAQVLGIPKLRQFTSITLPYLRKPLISVVFATFTLIVTDYGVPLMVGGKYITVPVVMYQEVIGQLNFGKGAVYGCLLLIPAVVAFIIDLVNKDKGNSQFISKRFEPAGETFRNVISYVYCGTVSIFTILTLISFIILAFTSDYPNNLNFSFNNVIKTLNLRASEYLMNSITIAFFVSAIGVAVAFMTAYMSARMRSKVSKFLHLSAITSAAIPGIVLGLSYVLVFNGSAVYGTITILVMVNLVHFIASPYLMMYNSLSKINENLEGVGHTLGISRGHMIIDVFIPQCKETMIEMFSYFFVNCMMTISAVSFLASTANKPVSLMINQFEAQMQLECAAVVSLAILAVNMIIKGAASVMKTMWKN
ncbi:ABC transporter permease subunit [Cloacibacillus evryensis]|uniref:ABC transporter permease subunit n=1 Tax=Cloacibacillus evryensis TaxID=508460 RepID=UPI0004AC6013|nr:ABC transporter permease subunit [Cloacibacillus evryensis]MEA5035714.1 ABC transporter permease subunit [Cloacibacillus evryensis]